MFLQAHNLLLNYTDGDKIISPVNDVSLSLDQTGLYGILGPSGSGKSSLLYLLSGIKQPTQGLVRYQNVDLSDLGLDFRRQEIGFVFQFHFLVSYLTVAENVFLGTGKKDVHDQKYVQDLLLELDIFDLKDRFLHQLSGGQKQRVALARAVANKPKVLFVDEPTASLDHKRGKEIVALLEKLSHQICVIVVTHDHSNLTNAKQVFYMEDGKLSIHS
jgi:putative ABC transport system ATP-binding protein